MAISYKCMGCGAIWIAGEHTQCFCDDKVIAKARAEPKLQVGDRVKTEGGRVVFTIVCIRDDRVQIRNLDGGHFVIARDSLCLVKDGRAIGEDLIARAMNDAAENN